MRQPFFVGLKIFPTFIKQKECKCTYFGLSIKVGIVSSLVFCSVEFWLLTKK